MLKQLVPFSVTEGSLCSSSFNSVIKLAGTSVELFYDKVLWTMLHSDSLTSLNRFSDKVLCTMISFYLSSSVSLTFDDGSVSSA